MSVAWSSGYGGSVVARHEWKGLLKMPGALEDFVEKQRLESRERSANSLGSMLSPSGSVHGYVLESDGEDG